MSNYHKERDMKNQEEIREYLSSLPSFVSDYFLSIQTRTTTLTRLGYAKDIHTFFEYLSESLGSEITLEQLDGLERVDFDAFIDYLTYYEKDGISYTNSPASLRRKLSSLRGLWSYLYEENKLSENVLTKVRNPKLRKKEIIRLDKKEQTEFLGKVNHGILNSRLGKAQHDNRKERDLAIITLLLSTGMRVSELVGIDLKDLSMEKCSVRIIRKGNKEDLVFFSDECKKYLQDYLFVRKGIKTDTNALFLSNRKQRISVRMAETLVKEYGSAVTLKHITPHKLRSTYGSALYDETGDIYLVAKVLGHNSVDTTSKYYIHSDEKQKEANRNTVKLS